MTILRRYRVELLLFACMFAVFGSYKWNQYRCFWIRDYDTGVYSNVAWNIAHGQGFYSAVNRRNQMGEHFSPIMAAFAPLYRVWETPLNILIPQAAAVALAIVLFYEIALLLSESLPARERRWFVATCTAMAVFYLPLQSALNFEFHPSTLGMPMLAGAVLCMHRKKWIAFWLLIAALLTTKELALLSIVGLGLYAGFVLRRRRLMLVLIAIAIVGAAIIFGWVMPGYRGPKQWNHYNRLDLFAEPGLKLKYVFLLALYLGLTPLFGGAALLATLPTTLLNLSVSMRNQLSMRFHYDDQNCVFWIIAGMYGLLYLYGRARGTSWAARKPWRVQCVLALWVICCSFSGGGVKFARQWEAMHYSNSKKGLRAAIAKYVAMPPDVGIATQTGLGPYLCHRNRYAQIENNYIRYKMYKPGDYILLSTRVDRGDLKYDEVIAAFKADPKLKLIKSTKYLTVFRAQ